MRATVRELYALYLVARENGCDCPICKRLRQKAWDDQNDLEPGVIDGKRLAP